MGNKMVNVTKENFIEQSNDLLKHLPTAAFVAIDEEMTGIQLLNSKRPPTDDLPFQRYQQTMKPVAEKYSIIQLGVVLFHEHPDYSKNNTTPEFLVRKYNFYAYPDGGNDEQYTREVCMNPSTTAFLSSHNMSFDTWCKQGISYVTSNDVEKILEKYKKERTKLDQDNEIKAPSNTRKVIVTKQDDIHFIARTMASMREWLDSSRGRQRRTQGQSSHPLEGSSFVLPPCNAFLRRALYESIEMEYPALVLEKFNKDQIRVWRMNAQERRNRQVRLQREGWEAMIMKVGLWRVFRAISNACRGYKEVDSLILAKNVDQVDLHAKPRLEKLRRQVPVVVHNGFFDLLFLMTHFYSHKLPDSYEGMKALIAHHFPVIYDTKTLASEYAGPDIQSERSTLENLYTKLVTESTQNRRALFRTQTDMADEEQAHEASFDAFMTGCIFVGLFRNISRIKGYEADSDDDSRFPRGQGVGSLFPLLEPIDHPEVKASYGRNMLCLMQSMYTIDLEDPHSDPFSKDVVPAASFRVSGIDPAVNTRDIALCFSSVATPHPVDARVIWVDDTTFIVAYKKQDQDDQAVVQLHGSRVREALMQRFQGATVISLEQYRKNVEQAAKREAEPSWTSRLSTAMWGLLGYRKRDSMAVSPETEIEHPRAKRRRLE